MLSSIGAELQSAGDPLGRRGEDLADSVRGKIEIRLIGKDGKSFAPPAGEIRHHDVVA